MHRHSMHGGARRNRLTATASLLALCTATQFVPSVAYAQTVAAPASRDDESRPQTDAATSAVPAGAAAGKKPLSNSVSIANQTAADQSNVTPADVQTPAAQGASDGDIVVKEIQLDRN